MVAKFSRFYSMGLMDVLNLPYEMFNEFCRYITVIENQERLVDNDVSSYPHINPKDRDKIYKEVFKKAYPEQLDDREVLTTDQAFIKLSKFIG